MKSIVSLAIAALLAGSALTDAGATALRRSVTVQGDVVRLGDLFAGVGKDTDTIVADAPAPGQRMTINARTLQSIAQRTGLTWRPDNRYQYAVVTRAGRNVSTRRLESLIRAAMVRKGMPRDLRIALSKSDLTVSVAADETRPVRVADARYNLAGRQFSAILDVPRGEGRSQRLQVSGNMYEMVEVPVLTHRVQRGETIRDDDVAMIEMRRDAIARDAILDRSEVVGKSPRRFLRAEKPLRVKDLQAPILVEKGRLVTIVYRNHQLLITAQGRALENGSDGDVIRISNTRSRNTIQGVVVGLNRVNVGSLSPRP